MPSALYRKESIFSYKMLSFSAFCLNCFFVKNKRGWDRRGTGIIHEFYVLVLALIYIYKNAAATKRYSLSAGKH